MTQMREAIAKAIGPEKLRSVEWYMAHVCRICRIRPIYKRKLCYAHFKEVTNGKAD